MAKGFLIGVLIFMGASALISLVAPELTGWHKVAVGLIIIAACSVRAYFDDLISGG